jgi:hypothetical protein
VAGYCEHGTEQSGSIKGGKYLEYLRLKLVSEVGLCSPDLVIFSPLIAKYYMVYFK